MTKENMVVSCDIDDCLNNLIDYTLRVYNIRYCIHRLFNKKKYPKLYPSIFTEFNLSNCVNEEVSKKIYNIWKRYYIWKSLSPPNGAIEGLKGIIDDRYDVYLVTSTHYTNVKWKCKWLEKYYPFINYKKVIIAANKSLIKYDIIIDDNPQHILEADDKAIKICMDKPWNKYLDAAKYKSSNIHRVKNMLEAREILRKIRGNEVL